MLLKLILGQSFYIIGLYIFVTLLIALEIGYRLGLRLNRDTDADVTERKEKGAGIITSAILVLVAFTLSISISMAERRFEDRRNIVLEEANAIGTVYLRAQGIGGPQGGEIVRLLPDYTQLRIDFYTAGEDQKKLETINEQTAVMQKKIWRLAADAAAAAPTPIAASLWGSLNQAFDLASARRWAFEVRVPLQVFNFLHFISIVAIGIMGYYFSLSRHRHFILSSLLIFAFTISMLLVFDLDKPRSGSIKIEQAPLIWALESMKEATQ